MSWSLKEFYYTDFIQVSLPKEHRFPMHKYQLLREKLLADNILCENQLFKATPVSLEDLTRAHSPEYVMGLKNNTLSEKQLKPIGLPWSDELWHRSLHSVGGFIAATESALKHEFSAVLAGGTHHAHYDRGEGYCVFNDFAVAGLKLLTLKKVKNILILDLDVHQGNGNSSMLGKREDFFILSLHGEKNYPFRKVPSHLDIALPEGCDDQTYLQALKIALNHIPNIKYDIVFYQAGVDVLNEDKLGTFNLSFEGIMRRDEIVFNFAKSKNIPLAMSIGGGYADPIELTIRAYANTFKMAKLIY